TTSTTIALLAPLTFHPVIARAVIVDHAQRLLCGVYSAVARVAADRLAASADAAAGADEGDGDSAIVFYTEDDNKQIGWEFGPIFTLARILRHDWKTTVEIGGEGAIAIASHH